MIDPMKAQDPKLNDILEDGEILYKHLKSLARSLKERGVSIKEIAYQMDISERDVLTLLDEKTRT